MLRISESYNEGIEQSAFPCGGSAMEKSASVLIPIIGRILFPLSCIAEGPSFL
jgi:hypothetical protein